MDDFTKVQNESIDLSLTQMARYVPRLVRGILVTSFNPRKNDRNEVKLALNSTKIAQFRYAK